MSAGRPRPGRQPGGARGPLPGAAVVSGLNVLVAGSTPPGEPHNFPYMPLRP